MAQILSFGRRAERTPGAALAEFVSRGSVEVMPKTAAKIADFRERFAPATRIYVAHIAGTPIEDQVSCVARLSDEGFDVMPHVPARAVPDRATLEDWLRRYRDAGATSALLIAGGITQPEGPYASSMDVLETGLLDKLGFQRLHVAGHPEGNKDIDPEGGEAAVMEALRWKADFAERTDAEMAIATQFCFEAKPVIAWAGRLAAAGIDLPIHIGVAGPAKLQTLIKYAMLCGVGPSIRVLQARAADLTRLMLPFTPEAFLAEISAHRAATPGFQIVQPHFFPLGGIDRTAEFMDQFGRPAGRVQALA